MGWECRLYGQRWRHRVAYEVILPAEGVPQIPLERADCGAALALSGGERVGERGRRRSLIGQHRNAVESPFER